MSTDRDPGPPARYLDPSPALYRLQWILEGLSGEPGWGSDSAAALDPGFVDAIHPVDYVQRTLDRAPAYAPLTVSLLESAGHTARAQLRNRDGSIDVLSCTVAERAPHRILSTWLHPLVPTDLSPRLPAVFEAAAAGRSPTQLIIITGVPGTGKSTLAEALGRELGMPVFSIDWILGAFTPFGGRTFEHAWEMGLEVLTTLAFQQLEQGRSVILDAPAEEVATRTPWLSLASHFGSAVLVIECVCTDADEHRRRLAARTRGIPGWHEVGDWEQVRQRVWGLQPWSSDVLTLDAVHPVTENLDAVLESLGSSRPSQVAVPGVPPVR
ncbi:putative kinase [Arthrobacter sp. CAN_A6]|uniref:AAA family ATPase n=1 Tax=Arthrobacter sp. CAN_A6 TaxID=2787721 RepID=UPI0018CA9E85